MLRNVLKNPTSSAFQVLLGVVLAATSTIGSLQTGDRARAQSSPSVNQELELPKGLPSRAKLRVDGSTSMAMVNKTLKQRYEKQFPGATVELKAEGTARALQEVQNGKIEVAAIGRSLTAQEKAKGLQETRLNREKIAIVIGRDNPYRGNMTYQEFAKIFRGEITDWSQLGGPPGPIRLVDRPETSDTRQAFSSYKVFQDREFAAGATAEPLVADSTDEMVSQLGNDGIGYAIASQVMERDDVRIVPMHKTLPDDPRYPFSQPRSYVHKGAATSATTALLGVAGVVGQESISGAATVPPSGSGGSSLAIAPTTGTPTTTSRSGTAAPAAPPGVGAAPVNPATPSSTPKPEIVAVKPKTAQLPQTPPSPTETAALPPLPSSTNMTGLAENSSILPDFWWLLPIGLVALLVWWGVRKLRSQQALGLAPDESPPPPITGSETAALPPGNAPDVTSLPTDTIGNAPGAIANANLAETRQPQTPSTPETQANLTNIGLAGGAIAGGLAASTPGSQQRDELTPPPTIELPTPSETPIVPANVPPISELPPELPPELPNLAAMGEVGATETLDPEIQPPAPVTGTNLENLGLVGGAALAGGLAASEIGNAQAAAEQAEAITPIEVLNESQISLEPVTTDIAPVSDANWQAANPLETQTTPEGEIAPTLGEVEANLGDLGLVGGAALAGGLAASEMGNAEAAAEQAEAITPIEALNDSQISLEPVTTEIAPVSDANWQAANPLETQTTPEGGIAPTLGEVEANLGDLGLVGGAALAGGLAASEMGNAEAAPLAPEAITPIEALNDSQISLEPVTTEIAPVSDANWQAANPLETQTTPEGEIAPTLGEVEANLGDLGLVGGAALAGGLAASEMGNAEAAAEQAEERLTELETPAQISETEVAAAASIVENVNLAAAEDLLTAETEPPITTEIPAELTTSTPVNVEDIDDVPQEAGLAGGAVVPGGAAALAGGVGAAAVLGALEDAIVPEAVDEFIPAAAGADEFVPSVSDTDEFVPSVSDSSDDVTPVADNLAPDGERPSADPPDWAVSAAVSANVVPWSSRSVGVPVQLELPDDRTQSEVEAAKFNVGQSNLSAQSLASVDEGLPELPDGYGESRIVLVPCNPQWAYAYWDIPNEEREELRRQGGSQLALRFYDVTDIDITRQVPHSLQQYACDEICRDWYLPIPAADRNYIVEIGYVTNDGRWLSLVRSQPIRVPPLAPSDWQNDRFATVPWKQELSGDRTVLDLKTPQQTTNGSNPVYNSLFALAQAAEAQRVAGSEFMSAMGQFPSGAGLLTGMGISGSGLGMASGMGMSGAGFFASMPPMRSRKFWLVADAELIVYGATEPDATVTVGGVPIPLEPDGTFRFQMAFRDGTIDYPIMAVAADGQQSRSIHMNFNRETKQRNTNTKEEAEDEVY